MTPIEIDSPQDILDHETQPLAAAQSSRPPVPTPSENHSIVAVPLLSPAANLPLRNFPVAAETIDVAKLQEELRTLAETLETEYSTDPIAFHFAGQIYFELKQTKLAEVDWRKCIEQKVTAAGPYAGLAEILTGSGRERETIELLSAAHALGTHSAETYQHLAEAQENIGLLANANETLEKLIGLYPDDAEGWLARGRILNQLQEYSAAEESALQNIQLAGESEKALFILSTSQIRQKKIKEATETREQLSKLRAAAARQAGDFQDSYNSALRSIAVEVLLSSAALADKNQRPADAEKFAWRAIQLQPANSDAYMCLLGVLRSQGRLAEAFVAQQQLVQIHPENPLNQVNLASLATQMGEVQIAKEALIEAVELAPEGFVAQNSLVRLHMALGEFPEAKRIATEVLRMHRSVEAYVLLASVLQAAGENAAAESTLQQAKLLDPNHPIWTSQ